MAICCVHGTVEQVIAKLALVDLDRGRQRPPCAPGADSPGKHGVDMVAPFGR